MAALLLVALVLLGGCSPTNEDNRKLARAISASELEPRSFDYRAIGVNDSFDVKGSIQDDFRYKMLLSSGARELVQYVVRDDAVAVRLVDPKFGGRLANELGHPIVDAALKSGRWVVDPSGAPALFRRQAAAGTIKSGVSDPFVDTREALLTVSDGINEARRVKLFTLEDIEYRPLYDPWRYPDKESGEIRYDLLRPILPKTEGQASFGQGDQITPAQFRKTSVFVRRSRVETVCTLVDIEGHEEIQRLREQGLSSNRYLANVLKQIERGETSVPIQPRDVIFHLTYPRDVEVGLPSGAVIGKLDTFFSAFQQGVAAGVLRPRAGESNRDCVRTSNATS
jgi:hypothetical protein